MVVEELVSKLGLEVDSTALATLEKFRSAVVGGLSAMSVAAVGVGAAFLGMVHSVASAGDQIQNVAEKLGVSTDALQELKFAADQSDVTFESLTTGLKFLSKNAAEAAAGSKDAAASFAGIPLRNTNGTLKTADELLFSVTDRFNEIQDPIKQTELAMKLFGRSGVDLVPMLKQGTKGIEAFIEDAYDLGVVLDKDVIEASDRFDRQLKRLRDSFVGLRNEFAGPFVDDFADMMKAAADKVKTARNFVRDLSYAFRDAGQRMGGMAEMLKRAFDFFSSWFSESSIGRMFGLIKGFKVLEAVLIGLGVIFAVVAAQAIASWLAAAAPFILLGALIGFIVDDIYSFIKGNDSLIGRIQKWADAVGDPNEHPIVKFLRLSLALLLDFTDPAKWDRWKEAAGRAIDFVKEKLRVALGGKTDKELTTGRDENGFPTAPTPWEPAAGGMLDKLKRKFRPELFAPTLPGQDQTLPQDVHLQGPANYTPGPTINNHITINGSGLSGEELQSRIEDALSSSYSKALPAVSGGEK